MLQKEVVERLTAAPGGKDYGALTVFVATYCEARRLFDVPPARFARVRGSSRASSGSKCARSRPSRLRDEALYLRLVRAAFAQRRKTLENNLAAAGWRGLAATAGIDSKRRAETLGLEEFAALANAALENASPR